MAGGQWQLWSGFFWVGTRALVRLAMCVHGEVRSLCCSLMQHSHNHWRTHGAYSIPELIGANHSTESERQRTHLGE